MRPDAETIRSLVAFLEEEGLEEICCEAGGVRVRVRKEMVLSATSVPVGPVAAPGPVVVAKPKAPAPPAAPAATPANWRELLSPMAGIFYRAASARAEPFVREGDRVEAGQTVGLVEAMKTFNEVAAEFAGRVIEFRVRDAEAVQRGQPILVLKPMEVEV